VTDSLEAALTWYQHLRRIGEAILVAGLIGDLGVLMLLHERDKAERRWNIVFAILLILGVGIENFAGGRGDDVVRQMRAPRSLAEAQREAIAEKLKIFGAHEAVFYEVSDVDPEVAGITVDLSKACASAGWKSGFESWPPTPPVWLRAPGRGILILSVPQLLTKLPYRSPGLWSQC